MCSRSNDEADLDRGFGGLPHRDGDLIAVADRDDAVD